MPNISKRTSTLSQLKDIISLTSQLKDMIFRLNQTEEDGEEQEVRDKIKFDNKLKYIKNFMESDYDGEEGFGVEALKLIDELYYLLLKWQDDINKSYFIDADDVEEKKILKLKEVNKSNESFKLAPIIDRK